MAKKMTERQKKEAAQARAWLREKSMLPAKKKPINKKKLIADAQAAYGQLDTIGDTVYLSWGIGEMLGHHSYQGLSKSVISDQAVGVAKAILLAARRKELDAKRRESGETKPLTIGEVYEAVKDIYEL